MAACNLIGAARILAGTLANFSWSPIHCLSPFHNEIGLACETKFLAHN